MDHVVRLAPEGGWEQASPCEGWTARHVLGHVIAIQRFLEASINDTKPPMNPMENPEPPRRRGTPQRTGRATRDAGTGSARPARRAPQGGRPHSVASRRSTSSSASTWLTPPSTRGTWPGPSASTTGSIPAWSGRVTELVGPVVDKMRDPMFFADAVAVPADSDAQTKLLALLGRKA